MAPERSSIKLLPENATSTMHERAVLPNIPQKKCDRCHVSCLRCTGPSNFQCTECTQNMIYRENSPNETYCDPGPDEHEEAGGSPTITKLFSPHQINGTQMNLSHQSIFQEIAGMPTLVTGIIYILSVTIILLVLIMIYKLLHPNVGVISNNDKKNYAYNRIAFDGQNDQIIMEQELMIPNSDSSEEIFDTSK